MNATTKRCMPRWRLRLVAFIQARNAVEGSSSSVRNSRACPLDFPAVQRLLGFKDVTGEFVVTVESGTFKNIWNGIPKASGNYWASGFLDRSLEGFVYSVWQLVLCGVGVGGAELILDTPIFGCSGISSSDAVPTLLGRGSSGSSSETWHRPRRLT